jgi:hypothetical protein
MRFDWIAEDRSEKRHILGIIAGIRRYRRSSLCIRETL